MTSYFIHCAVLLFFLFFCWLWVSACWDKILTEFPIGHIPVPSSIMTELQRRSAYQDSWKRQFCWRNVTKCSSVNASRASYGKWDPFRCSILHKRWSFPYRIFSVNLTKCTRNCGLGHIYWRNPWWKTSFFVQCILREVTQFFPGFIH